MSEEAVNRLDDKDVVALRLRRACASLPVRDTSLVLQQKLFGSQGFDLGRYTLLRLLGEGAMGTVYEASDRARNQRVALKIFRHVGPHTAQLLKREFRALSDVLHPNLVMFHELSVRRDTCFFTMELVDGTDFVTFVRGAGSAGAVEARAAAREQSMVDGQELARPKDERVLLAREPAGCDEGARLAVLRQIMGQFAGAVRALHLCGKVHRDLKPSNVLVTKEGRVVVLDFGLITSFDGARRDITFGGQVVGTPAYMAPEQFKAQPVTPASDCYAIGGMLYHALTGSPPFSDHPPHELPQLRANRVPPLPANANYGVLGELCSLLLQPEPAARADCATILQRLGDVAAPRSRVIEVSSRTESSKFVGRSQELGLLSDALRAVPGGCVAVMVAGAGGSGKSSLLRQFLKTLDDRQHIVLVARCYEHESLPYKTLDGLVDALVQFMLQLPPLEVAALLPRYAPELVLLFPALARLESFAAAARRSGLIVDEQEQKRRAVLALQELLAKVAERGSLVLCVEDLQWGDRDSAAVIRQILMSADAPRCLCIGTVSLHGAVGDLPKLVSRFLGGQQVIGSELNLRVIRLEPLSRADATAMALRLLPEPDELRARQIAEEAAGSPVLIRQLAEFVSHFPSWRLGMSLHEMVEARVERLSAEAAQLLRLLALAGGSVEASLACLAARLDGRAEAMVYELRSAQLARRTSNGRLELYHHGLSPVLLQGLEAHVVRDLHARFAAALSERGRLHDERLMLHLQGAGRSAEAAAHAIDRAEAAAKALAHERAAHLYGLALKLGPSPALLDHVKLKRAEALHQAGRGRDAAYAYLEASQSASAEADAVIALRLRAAEHFLLSGELDQGRALLRTFLDLPSTRLSTLVELARGRIQLLLQGVRFCQRAPAEIESCQLRRLDQGWSLVQTLLLVDPLLGRLFQTRQLLEALRVGEPGRAMRALAGEAVIAGAQRGATGRADVLPMLQLAVSLSERVDQPQTQATAAMCVAAANYLIGEPEAALTEAARAERLLRERCSGVDHELGIVHLVVLRSQMMLGRWLEFSQRAQDAIREGMQRGGRAWSAALRVYTHLAYLLADDPSGANAEIAAAHRDWSHDEVHLQNLVVLGGEVRSNMYRGDGVAAFRHLHQLAPRMRRSPMLRISAMRSDLTALRGHAGALAYAQTQERSYRAAATREVQRLQQERFRGAGGTSLMIQASLEATDRAPATALRLLKGAALSFERDRLPFFAELARYQIENVSGQGHDPAGPLATFAAAGIRNGAAFARMYSCFVEP